MNSSSLPLLVAKAGEAVDKVRLKVKSDDFLNESGTQVDLSLRKYALGSSLPVRMEERIARRMDQSIRDAAKIELDRQNDVALLVLCGYPPEMAERIVNSFPYAIGYFLRIVGPYRG